MFVNRKKWLGLIFCFFAPASAYAVHCDVSATIFSFPAYDPLALASSDSSGEVIVQCDPGQPFQIKLDAGLYARGNFSVREMRSADTQTPLQYNLFLDPSYSQIWGDGGGASLFYRGIGSIVPFKVPLYGRVPAGQRVSAGQYSDSVVVTIEW